MEVAVTCSSPARAKCSEEIVVEEPFTGQQAFLDSTTVPSEP